MREEHLRGNSKHHLRVKGEVISIQTSKSSANASSETSTNFNKLDTIADIKNLKQICENDDSNEVPDWFSKSKDVRLQTCFPNAFDPKYLMAKRKLFKQMKILKEEQDAAKTKNAGSVIKLTPCAPPSFAKNLKFKPIKGHVMKPNEKSIPKKLPLGDELRYQNEINNLENEKNDEIEQLPDDSKKTVIEKSNNFKDIDNFKKADNSDVNKEEESQKNLADKQEKEMPRNRRTRRKV